MLLAGPGWILVEGWQLKKPTWQQSQTWNSGHKWPARWGGQVLTEAGQKEAGERESLRSEGRQFPRRTGSAQEGESQTLNDK